MALFLTAKTAKRSAQNRKDKITKYLNEPKFSKNAKVSHTQNIIELRHLLSAKCYIQGPTLIFDLSDFTLRVECTSRTGVGLLSSSRWTDAASVGDLEEVY